MKRLFCIAVLAAALVCAAVAAASPGPSQVENAIKGTTYVVNGEPWVVSHVHCNKLAPESFYYHCDLKVRDPYLPPGVIDEVEYDNVLVLVYGTNPVLWSYCVPMCR